MDDDLEFKAQLCGRTVLVVGGSSGIGFAISKGLANQGATVGVMSRTEPDFGDSANKIYWRKTDLSNSVEFASDLTRWADFPVSSIDAVFVTAVTYGERRCDVLSTPEDDWKNSFAVNSDGLFAVIQAIVPALTKRSHGGVFVGLTSEVVFNGGPNRAAYTASKSAAYALLTSLAQELSNSHVKVIQLMPSGMIRTPGIERRRSDTFDYADYGNAKSFVPVACRLVHSLGLNEESGCLVVKSDSSTYPAGSNIPPSQSNRASKGRSTKL